MQLREVLKERNHVRPDRTGTRADPIRIHDISTHHLPRDHHRPCELSRDAGRPVLWKKDTTYRDLYHFWSHIFAVNFAMGVVSGIVMAYQFGTNWSHYSAFAGTITGPLLSYEVLTAFFLEAGFLGVMLFGWSRVGPGLHFFATIMVAIGTLISAF